MTQRLAGRVAVVTGAASGQGAAVAVRFASEGADLVLADVQEEGLDQTRKAVEEIGRTALAVPTDLTREADLRALAAAAGEAFGPVDVLYNNAGVISGGDVDVVDWDVFDRVMAVNAKSQLFLVKHALPYLKAAGRSSIVNVSSVGGPRRGAAQHRVRGVQGRVWGSRAASPWSWSPSASGSTASHPAPSTRRCPACSSRTSRARTSSR